MHGGAAPQVRHAAQRRLFEERLARHAARWDRMKDSTQAAHLRAFMPLGVLPTHVVNA